MPDTQACGLLAAKLLRSSGLRPDFQTHRPAACSQLGPAARFPDTQACGLLAAWACGPSFHARHTGLRPVLTAATQACRPSCAASQLGCRRNLRPVQFHTRPATWACGPISMPDTQACGPFSPQTLRPAAPCQCQTLRPAAPTSAGYQYALSGCLPSANRDCPLPSTTDPPSNIESVKSKFLLNHFASHSFF